MHAAERRQRELEEAERLRLEAEQEQLAAEAAAAQLEQERLRNEAVDLEKYRSEFFGQLRDLLGAQQGVRIVGDRFVFSSEVLFPPARAQLSQAGQVEIAKIVTTLQTIVQDIPSGINWVLQVDGHTELVFCQTG